jgi:hypothetical protein
MKEMWVSEPSTLELHRRERLAVAESSAGWWPAERVGALAQRT